MIGDFDRRITVQSESDVQLADGTPLGTWSTYCTRWAKMEAAGGTENYDADQLTAERRVKWTLRRDDTTKAISESMRVLFDGIYYQIEVVQEATEQRRYGFIELMTVKKGSVDA